DLLVGEIEGGLDGRLQIVEQVAVQVEGEVGEGGQEQDQPAVGGARRIGGLSHDGECSSVCRPRWRVRYNNPPRASQPARAAYSTIPKLPGTNGRSFMAASPRVRRTPKRPTHFQPRWLPPTPRRHARQAVNQPTTQQNEPTSEIRRRTALPKKQPIADSSPSS